MESVFKKHWSILQQDPYLKSIIPTIPQFTYRKAPNIEGKVAPGKIKPSRSFTEKIQLTLIPLIGMFQCKKPLYLTCSTWTKKSFSHKGKTFHFNTFHNCSSMFVVYCLSYPCGMLYVGRTIRTLQARFGEHCRFVEAGLFKHSVPHHFLEYQKKSSRDFKSMGP